MPKKQPASSKPPSGSPSTLPSPQSRREELLDSLVAHTQDPVHLRILKAYKDSQTVLGAEDEFSKIIEEIVNET
jgi:hypothetical protein